MRKGFWLVLGLLVLVGRTDPALAQPTKEDPERLNVIRVELAMLGDPELCCYYPSADLETGKLKLGGYLPSAALRDKAVQVAQFAAQMPAQDEIKILPACRTTFLPIPNQALMQTAAQALKQGFASEFRQWQLGLRNPGEVVIAGNVDSYEKKLQVSQRLRAVPGCRCVLNQLQVGHSVSAPVSVTTAPGVPTQPGTPLLMLPTTPAKNPTYAPVPGLPTPSTSKPALATSVVKNQEAQVLLGPAILPVQSEPEQNSSVSHPLLSDSNTGTEPMEPTKIAKKPGNFDHVAAYPNPGPPVTSVWQAASPVPPSPAPVLPAPKTEPETQVWLSPPEASPTGPALQPLPANQAPLASEKLAELRKLIQQACGENLSKLELTQTGNQLAVQYHAPDGAEADRLAQVIMTLPCLDSFRLKLKVEYHGQ